MLGVDGKTIEQERTAHQGGLKVMVLRSDGRTLVTTGADGFVRIWFVDAIKAPGEDFAEVSVVAATAVDWHNIRPMSYPAPDEPNTWKALDLRDWDLNPATGKEEAQPPQTFISLDVNPLLTPLEISGGNSGMGEARLTTLSEGESVTFSFVAAAGVQHEVSVRSPVTVLSWLHGLGLAHKEKEMWQIPGAAKGGLLKAIIKYANDDALDGVLDKLDGIIQSWDVADGQKFKSAAMTLRESAGKEGGNSSGGLTSTLLRITTKSGVVSCSHLLLPLVVFEMT